PGHGWWHELLLLRAEDGRLASRLARRRRRPGALARRPLRPSAARPGPPAAARHRPHGRGRGANPRAWPDRSVLSRGLGSLGPARGDRRAGCQRRGTRVRAGPRRWSADRGDWRGGVAREARTTRLAGRPPRRGPGPGWDPGRLSAVGGRALAR